MNYFLFQMKGKKSQHYFNPSFKYWNVIIHTQLELKPYEFIVIIQISYLKLAITCIPSAPAAVP